MSWVCVIQVAEMRGGNQVPKNTAVAEEWYTWEAGREECMFSVTRVNAVRDDYHVRKGCGGNA